jgi:hypothetical protein
VAFLPRLVIASVVTVLALASPLTLLAAGIGLETGQEWDGEAPEQSYQRSPPRGCASERTDEGIESQRIHGALLCLRQWRWTCIAVSTTWIMGCLDTPRLSTSRNGGMGRGRDYSGPRRGLVQSDARRP